MAVNQLLLCIGRAASSNTIKSIQNPPKVENQRNIIILFHRTLSRTILKTFKESRSLIKVLTRFLRNKRKFYDFEKIDIILIIDDCGHSISLPSPSRSTVAYHRHRVLELRCFIPFAREKKVSTTTPNRARARETLINFRDEREIVKFIASISH